VDDDADDREIFCAVMEIIAPSCNCVTAGNGQVALEMLIAKKVSPDIIFLDLNMPLMSGFQFLQEINRLKIVQDIPIIVLTTSADMSTKAAILSSGAKEFITKPDKFSEWETVLRQVVGNWLNTFHNAK
jgi:CheY-like chemotaxis protein